MGLIQMYLTYLHELFGGNELYVSAFGTYVLLVLTFWGVNLPFVLVDLTGSPSWVTRYKVQPAQNIPVDRYRLKKVLKTVAINNLVLNLVFSYNHYTLQKRGGMHFHPDGATSWSWFFVELAVYSIVNEIIFYYSHRLFHHPWLYKYVHKKHHQWTAPISLVAIYATPLEYLTGNGLSVVLGPVFMGSHITSAWTWYVIAFLFTTVHHSGYHLPFMPSPEFHDYHHLTFNWNFGTFGLLDRLHGTDAQFRHSVQKKRDQLLRGLRPMTRLFPDKDGAELRSRAAAGQQGKAQ